MLALLIDHGLARWTISAVTTPAGTEHALTDVERTRIRDVLRAESDIAVAAYRGLIATRAGVTAEQLRAYCNERGIAAHARRAAHPVVAETLTAG